MLATLRSIVTFSRPASTLATPNDDLNSDKCVLDFIRSATMAADLDQFQQLLNTLLSTDNDARTQAEVCRTPTRLLAMCRGRRSRRQEREYTRVHRAAAHSVASTLPTCCQSSHVGVVGGVARATRDPSVGSSANPMVRSEENPSRSE